MTRVAKVFHLFGERSGCRTDDPNGLERGLYHGGPLPESALRPISRGAGPHPVGEPSLGLERCWGDTCFVDRCNVVGYCSLLESLLFSRPQGEWSSPIEATMTDLKKERRGFHRSQPKPGGNVGERGEESRPQGRPARRPAPVGRESTRSLPPPGAGMIVRKRVLVIEDDPHDRELVEAFLGPAHYEVQTAEGGGLGLSAATAHPPDIILLDIRLPDLDGYEVCRQLRKAPETQRIPIVIITASEDLALNRDAYAAGAQACLPKPFRKEALITVIEAVLAGSRRRTSASRRGEDASPSREPKEHAMMWETLEPYRDFLISVKQLGPTGWAAAVTPLPQPAEGRAPAAAPSNELIFPEGFDSQTAAEAAAKRYVDREHDRQPQREAPEGGEGVGGPGKHPGQRRFLRFPVYLPVIGFAPQLELGEIIGVVRTVSAGGLMVELPVELAPGSAVDLALLTQRGPLEVEAQSVWTAASGGTVRHGLAFPQPKAFDFAIGLSVEGSG